MGDRGNIVIKEGRNQVWLYTHWSGSDIEDTLKSALSKAPDRRADAPYLARIVFQELVGDDHGTTGYGISGSIGDNEHPVLVCDCDTQTVYHMSESALVEGRLPEPQKKNGRALPLTDKVETFKKFSA